MGVDAGRIFSVADQNFYIDAQYAYAFVQKFLGLSLNRSNVDVDLGYFVLPALNLRGIVSWQNTYGGLTAKEIFGPDGPPQKNPDLAEALWLGHDRLIRDDYWRAGVGASYSVNETLGVYFTAVNMIAGKNSWSRMNSAMPATMRSSLSRGEASAAAMACIRWAACPKT